MPFSKQYDDNWRVYIKPCVFVATDLQESQADRLVDLLSEIDTNWDNIPEYYGDCDPYVLKRIAQAIEIVRRENNLNGNIVGSLISQKHWKEFI